MLSPSVNIVNINYSNMDQSLLGKPHNEINKNVQMGNTCWGQDGSGLVFNDHIPF